MKIPIFKTLLIILVTMILLIAGLLFVDHYWSSLITLRYDFNLTLDDAKINLVSSNGQNVIILIGHAYGDPYDLEATPTLTIIQSIDKLNNISPGLIIMMGDLVRKAEIGQWERFDANFLSQVNAPVINAPGNHDLGDRGLYEELFGQTYYYSQYRDSLIIVLDSILDQCVIVGRQSSMLEQAIASGLSNPKVERFLIVVHNLIFFSSDDALSKYANQKCAGNNFSALIDRILGDASKLKPIYLIAGDVGAFDEGGNLSPYYYKYPDFDIFTIAVGLGSGKLDKGIIAKPKGKYLDFEVISFTEQEIMPLERYDRQYWLEHYGEIIP